MLERLLTAEACVAVDVSAACCLFLLSRFCSADLEIIVIFAGLASDLLDAVPMLLRALASSASCPVSVQNWLNSRPTESSSTVGFGGAFADNEVGRTAASGGLTFGFDCASGK